MLQTDGYDIISHVFEPTDIAKMRSVVAHFLDGVARHPQLGAVRMGILDVMPLPLTALASALRQRLGDDFVLLPESAAHASGFGDWHKDTTSQERAGLTFHRAADFAVVQVAIYLQDGGLEVLPGSHQEHDRYLQSVDRTFIDRVRTKLKQLLLRRRGVELDSKAGDAVVFDLRLDHKASWTRPAVEKLAVFFVASANNAHARSYLEYIRSRPDYGYLRDYRPSVELQRACAEAGVRLL